MTGVDMKALVSLSKDLNKASDALSQQIAKAESALNEVKLGVSAWVQVARSYTHQSDLTVNGQPAAVTELQYLGYGKHQGKWCLLYSTEYEEYPEEELQYVVPLRDAPRLERIKAVDKLPELIRALEKNAKELADKANAKATQVAEFVTALDGAKR
jgi:ABC-type transporter Mla subunit MlaD